MGENARRMVSEMKDGDILVLQNTRFRPEETKNLPEFSKELASLADVYVDDAFGSAHRAHCSTVGVTDYIKETAVGYLMEKEINYLAMPWSSRCVLSWPSWAAPRWPIS